MNILAVIPHKDETTTEAVRTYLRGVFPDQPVLVLDQPGVAVYRAEAQARLDGIERKVDMLVERFGQLLNALAEDEGDEPTTDLDGNPQGGERDQSQSL